MLSFGKQLFFKTVTYYMRIVIVILPCYGFKKEQIKDFELENISNV